MDQQETGAVHATSEACQSASGRNCFHVYAWQLYALMIFEDVQHFSDL